MQCAPLWLWTARRRLRIAPNHGVDLDFQRLEFFGGERFGRTSAADEAVGHDSARIEPGRTECGLDRPNGVCSTFPRAPVLVILVFTPFSVSRQNILRFSPVRSDHSSLIQYAGRSSSTAATCLIGSDQMLIFRDVIVGPRRVRLHRRSRSCECGVS